MKADDVSKMTLMLWQPLRPYQAGYHGTERLTDHRRCSNHMVYSTNSRHAVKSKEKLMG